VKYLVALGLSALLLSGCAGDNTGDSPASDVAQAAFVSTGPKSISVITVINNRTGKGGHSALLINGSQQVIFDPAGSFRDTRVIERHDVLYGMSPVWIAAYESAHARRTHHVVRQTIPVTAAQAEQALSIVRSYGSVPGAFCTQATTDVLSQIDGFGNIERTYYPERLMTQIAQRPDVRTAKHYENDEGDVIDAVEAARLAKQP
jgi:hypothetical protein